MAEIRLITKDDFPLPKYELLDWDVEVHGIPYQIIRVPGFAHSLGGPLDYGDGNNFWAYPLGEEPSYENLIEFNGEPGATWGIEYTPTNYIRSKWDETCIWSGRKLVITRNGKCFYDDMMTFHQAIAYVKDGLLDDHPLELNSRDYDKKAIGRKVWWRSEPGIITWCHNGRVGISPDGMEKFSIPKEFEKNSRMVQEDRESEIITTIFDEHIWWFRD